ncbi:MAG: DUF1684 domain-containing protein [Acidobacteria bacterium]|nr:DUF1684 domain-containing protein [Acidobacteriota bacterium]
MKRRSGVRRRTLCTACGLLALVLCGCGRAPEPPPPPEGAPAAEAPGTEAPWTEALLLEREAKDSAFRSGAQSPMPAAERAAFRGLSYYPVDPALRFSVRLHRYEVAAPVRMGTNTGEVRDALRYGWFEFRVGDRDCRLEVFRFGDTAAPSLFVPFRDATSGDETYGAGRYVDLAENTSGTYDLDFNRAYNPYCAYNPGYVCPLPPAANTLSVPVRAGEKKYPPAGKTGKLQRRGGAKGISGVPKTVLS